MKFKNLLVLLLAFTLVVSLAACGGGNNNNGGNNGNTAGNTPANNEGAAEEEEILPEAGAELLVWNSSDMKALVEEAGAAFEAEYGVKVTYADVGADKSITQMLTDGPAGLGADVFAAVHDRLGSAVDAGIVLPNDLYEAETVEATNETAIQAVTFDGKLYGYPYSVETTAMFYNKDLIAEAPKTWDEVFAFAKEFNKNGQYAYMYEAGNGYWGFPIYGGFGAYVFGDNGTNPDDIGMNSPEAVEAAKFSQRVKAEVLPLNTSDITADIKTSLFTDGKLAMNISGPWQSAEFKEKVPNVAVAPYPAIEEGKPLKPFSGVKAYFVSSNTKYPIASRMFANFVTAYEYQKKAFETIGVLPANKEMSEDPIIANDPIASGFLAQFTDSTPMPSIPEMSAYWSSIEGAFAAIWNENADPQATLDRLVQTMKETMQTGAQ